MSRKNFYKILLIVASIILCLCVSVTFLFGWFTIKTKNMLVQVSGGDMDVAFYRLRDSNWDGVYDYTDFAYDYKKQEEITDFTFSDFEGVLSSSYQAQKGESLDFSEDAYDSEKITLALNGLSYKQILKYTYTTSFENLVERVVAGSRVSYKICIKNKMDKELKVDLSFSDLLSYYPNITQMTYYHDNNKINADLPDDDKDIVSYAAKFLFSIDIGEEQTIPLLNFQSRQSFMSHTLGQKGAENEKYDFDFSLVYDAKSTQAEYRDSICKEDSQVYQDCLKKAQTLGYDSTFLSSYLQAMVEEEMKYLFTDNGMANTNNLQLTIKYIQVMGTVQ